MVTVENITDEESKMQWEERLLDAQEIEKVATSLNRHTARIQLESLAKRLRKESEALKRVSLSQQKHSDEKMEIESNNTPPSIKEAKTEQSSSFKPQPTEVIPNEKASYPPVVSSLVKFVPIDRFAFDAGGYNAPFVTLYVDLRGVGSIPRENIECHYTEDSFDLIVKDLEGKSYRLFKDSLEKKIDPKSSKIIVKSDKVLVKLAKVKQSDYGGYDYWSKLTDTKTKEDKGDPSKSIMNLMKQMYDEGDDNMKKMIGETMMKQRNGELGNSKDDFMKDI